MIALDPTEVNISDWQTLDQQWVQLAGLLANDRECSVIGDLWLAKLPNVRGRLLTQMLTERMAECFFEVKNYFFGILLISSQLTHAKKRSTSC